MASKDWSQLAKEFASSRTDVPAQFEEFVANSEFYISTLWHNTADNLRLVEGSPEWETHIYEFWYGTVTSSTRGYSNLARHSGGSFDIALFHSTICDFLDDIGLSKESKFMKEKFLER